MSSIAIIGSGIVGLCTAIELLKTGHSVTLFDRSKPCAEASRWNAGVLSTSSLMPLNNPSLFRKLPSLLANKNSGFRYDYNSALKTATWSLRFLANARASQFDQTVSDLHELIQFSRAQHELNLKEIGAKDSLTRNGWMYLYRTQDQFQSSQMLLDILSKYGVKFDIVDGPQIQELEPALTTEFHRGLHLTESMSANPAQITQLYQEHAEKLGGIFLQDEITAISRQPNGYKLSSQNGDCGHYDQVVIAAGPWSNKLLKPLGKQLPMAVERGYLQTFSLNNDATINRPLYDVANGYVISPRPDGIQISSGTELTSLGSRPNFSQIDAAIEKVKTILPIGTSTMKTPAIGNRPTLTDSKPAIGPINGYPGLWLACGHQHIGFSTSAGTGQLLASQMNKMTTTINPSPYLPARFGI